jgi:hypothetical protein
MVFMYLFLFHGYDIIITTTICIVNNFYLFYLLDTQVDEHRKYYLFY